MQKQLQKLLKIAVAVAVEILLNVSGLDTLASYSEFVFDPQRFDKSSFTLTLNSFVQPLIDMFVNSEDLESLVAAIE
ncbi:hypothetical protein [Chamaesiphon polymorphus]|uniref:Uncharacterized protein n=1 Tax=Chamaesiphon polymorphus CCALA 037 TaxID=2107692 RepID=A0A2T1GI35_9CYAN|nr:hypothetical protein [Chamaesiphon polymorphus]PSB57388.1 hypothetical protein C7B77_08490 [Chamaesiphon polymorphus CCALA 037]